MHVNNNPNFKKSSIQKKVQDKQVVHKIRRWNLHDDKPILQSSLVSSMSPSVYSFKNYAVLGNKKSNKPVIRF